MDDLLNKAALLQSIILLGLGAAATFFSTRFWKGWEARKKLEDETRAEEKAVLRARNEAADTERIALQEHVKKLLTEQANLEARFTGLTQWTQKIGDEMLEIKTELTTVARQASHNANNIDHLKEALPRLESRITQVLDTLLRPPRA